MSGSDEECDLPIACDLTSLAPQERQRRETLAARLAASIRAQRELPDGYEITLSGEVTAEELRELLAYESRCCAFLRIHALETQGDGEMRLTLTGPEGTKSFLREVLLSPGRSISGGAGTA